MKASTVLGMQLRAAVAMDFRYEGKYGPADVIAAEPVCSSGYGFLL